MFVLNCHATCVCSPICLWCMWLLTRLSRYLIKVSQYTRIRICYKINLAYIFFYNAIAWPKLNFIFKIKEVPGWRCVDEDLERASRSDVFKVWSRLKSLMLQTLTNTFVQTGDRRINQDKQAATHIYSQHSLGSKLQSVNALPAFGKEKLNKYYVWPQQCEQWNHTSEYLAGLCYKTIQI